MFPSLRISFDLLLYSLIAVFFFALLSAAPQLSGLTAIGTVAPVTPGFRILSQMLLIGPLIFLVMQCELTRHRLGLLFTGVAAIAYAHFPSPFFDYIWDVFLIECAYALLLSVAMAGNARTQRYFLWPSRLLLFKLMFCMGVVKFVYGMPEWRSGTALTFFWENQPMPAYLAWYGWQLPLWAQKACSGFVFLAEVPGPFLIFLGSRGRRLFFWINALLQAGIFISGNYGFFNILTLALGFCLFNLAPPPVRSIGSGQYIKRLISIVALAGGIGWITCGIWQVYRAIMPSRDYLPETSWIFMPNPEQLSIPLPLRVTLQSYAAAKVANPYALFGHVSKYRLEIGIEGSVDGVDWRNYNFRVKPRDIHRPPVHYAPHHWRLDHQMYYESFRIRNPALHEQVSFFLGVKWSHNLLKALFLNDARVMALFRDNPFPITPPRYLRFIYAYYGFATGERIFWRTTPPHQNQFFEKPFTIGDIGNLP